MLRKEPHGQSEQMIEAMKEQAAVRLSAVPADAPVDRSGLIRLGYVLCAVLISPTVYAFVGPKDTFLAGAPVGPGPPIRRGTGIATGFLAQLCDGFSKTRHQRRRQYARALHGRGGVARDRVARDFKIESERCQLMTE